MQEIFLSGKLSKSGTVPKNPKKISNNINHQWKDNFCIEAKVHRMCQQEPKSEITNWGRGAYENSCIEENLGREGLGFRQNETRSRQIR